MIKCVYANGDSFAFAQGIDGLPASPKTIYDFNDIKRNFGYAGIISKKLGAEKYVNSSLPGGSNDRMVRTTIADLVELEKEFAPSETLVLLGWTAAERTEFLYEPSNTYFPFLINCPPDVSAPKKLYELFTAYFNSDEAQATRFLNQVLLMQGYLKSKGYKYLFSESILTLVSQMKPILSLPGNDSLKQSIDMTRYVQPCFSTFNAAKECGITVCHHPSLEGHAVWATHLLDFMESHEIL